MLLSNRDMSLCQQIRIISALYGITTGCNNMWQILHLMHVLPVFAHCRLEAVGSLKAATKALHRYGCQKQHHDSRVLHHLQNLHPSAEAVQKLQGQLQGSAGLKNGAPSM